MESNPHMHATDRTDQRLTELEIKASYTEDTLDRLNEVVVRQQQQIDLLLHELVQLREQGGTGELPSVRSLRDELPPHY
jgi:SlyX protein